MPGDLDKSESRLQEATSSSSSAVAAGVAEEHEEQEAGKGDEEDTGAQIAPIVKLEEVAISTGEENEDVLIDLKAKLYRFDKEGKQWKERGVGQVKLLKHKEAKRVRLLMRQNKTLKICANHLVLSTTSLQEHAGSDKSWVWHATDFSDGDLKEELFCIRLGSVENAQKFKELFEEVQESAAETSAEHKQAADSAAELLENLDVKQEENEESTP
ncbi:hypothetical protein O6H91_05G117500 [Diphasiastrum complanatum]|uniref:Uncharacterized protein n=1 Tax=Diphasiastrum complanatum TaxID=34168 RepID=A0ACC2DSR9_DIPCM|nr:hypothetical protein O6H91_05G117500 [Diphasiastrum complanatum]